jgi:hypothetical protein
MPDQLPGASAEPLSVAKELSIHARPTIPLLYHFCRKNEAMHGVLLDLLGFNDTFNPLYKKDFLNANDRKYIVSPNLLLWAKPLAS